MGKVSLLSQTYRNIPVQWEARVAVTATGLLYETLSHMRTRTVQLGEQKAVVPLVSTLAKCIATPRCRLANSRQGDRQVSTRLSNGRGQLRVSVCADFAGDDHIRRLPSDVRVEQIAFFTINSDFALLKTALGAEEALVLL